MNELLPMSVGIGLALSLLITELFGVASGGLVVPGYLALYLLRPWNLALTIGVALVSYTLVRVLGTFMIVFGRRRTVLMILFGYVFGMLVHLWAGFFPEDYSVIGFVIPGLIAVWMDRQGIVETLCSMTIVSVVVRIILILIVGTEIG